MAGPTGPVPPALVQLRSAIDVATNFLHCSLSSAMPHSLILRLPDVFPNFVRLTLSRSSSTQSIHLFDSLPLDVFRLAATDKLF